MIVIQIGTNTASWEENGDINYDSCLEFVSKNHKSIDFLHLIEPLKECNSSIEKSYNFFNKKKIHNIAITNDENQHEIEIFTPESNQISAHASFNLDHLIQLGHSGIISIKTPCYTLNNFFKLNNIERCDRLYIYTEGLDCLILLDYDYNRFKTNYIEFEVFHADGHARRATNAEKCIERLTADGFNIENASDSLNLIAYR
jgi:hypothetical protein